MNYPATYNFPTHYRGDGLNSFTLTLKYSDQSSVDLTGASVLMQLRDLGGRLSYTFSTETNLTLPGTGVIQFETIEEWTLRTGKYKYDLQVTDSTGFVRTYLRGEWLINQDITNG
jgi:hypothetical protein